MAPVPKDAEHPPEPRRSSPPSPPNPASSAPILELEAVSKIYGRESGAKRSRTEPLYALRDVTLSVRPGCIGLLGPNGAGKSTLIKTLLGLLRMSSGSARVLGLDCRTQSRAIRECVGYMPEDDCAIAGMKGVESVAFAGELAGLPRLTALRRSHEILDFVGMYEERYREVQTYSTGMRQKIKLAQALIHSPKLVFLDEPTSGLDPVGRQRMLRLIRTLATRKGVSVVVSTHILHDVEACCDQVLILGRGELLVHDRIESLKESVDEGVLVRFDGNEQSFREELERSGFQVRSNGPGNVSLHGGPLDDLALFRAARATETSVRQILRSRSSLEERFLEAVRQTAAGDPSADETEKGEA